VKHSTIDNNPGGSGGMLDLYNEFADICRSMLQMSVVRLKEILIFVVAEHSAHTYWKVFSEP